MDLWTSPPGSVSLGRPKGISALGPMDHVVSKYAGGHGENSACATVQSFQATSRPLGASTVRKSSAVGVRIGVGLNICALNQMRGSFSGYHLCRDSCPTPYGFQYQHIQAPSKKGVSRDTGSSLQPLAHGLVVKSIHRLNSESRSLSKSTACYHIFPLPLNNFWGSTWPHISYG